MARAKVGLTLLVALIVLAAAGAGYLYKTLDDTRQVLATTRADLATTQGLLAQEQLKGREANDRIAALDAELVRISAELADTQAKLAASNDTVEKQKGDVAAFKKCLDGVTRAVVSASNRNTGEAQTILSAAKADCDRAYATQ